jgi:hypothetical protein
MKVILALAVVAVVAGLGVSWAKEKADSVIHHAIDTGLPAKVEAKAWAPLDHGKRIRADRVRFDDGHLMTVRCHGTLGGYSIHIDHAFAFEKDATPIRAHCPGRSLRASLADATRVDVDAHGKGQELTFRDKDGDTVATFVSR